jgi:hypothetical protein
MLINVQFCLENIDAIMGDVIIPRQTAELSPTKSPNQNKRRTPSSSDLVARLDVHFILFFLQYRPEEAGPNSAGDAPTEVLLLIFSFLDGESLSACQQVCKRCVRHSSFYSDVQMAMCHRAL